MFSPTLLFLNIGSSEMVLIMFVALLLFGGDKLPQLAKGLGKGIRDFKDASEGVKRELHNQINSFDEKTANAPEALTVDPNAPVVEHTTPVADPFAVVDHNAPVIDHNAPVIDHKASVISEENKETASLASQQIAAAFGNGESHADVSHLVNHTEVTKVSENHISLQHVSDEAKAGEEPVINNSTK